MSQIDLFATTGTGGSGPAIKHYAITPDDDDDLPRRPRALFCTASGDIVIRDADATEVTYALVAGDLLPFRAVRILATGTTATVIGWE